MIEIFHNGKTTGIIEADTEINRARALQFIRRYNAHYGVTIRLHFKEPRETLCLANGCHQKGSNILLSK